MEIKTKFENLMKRNAFRCYVYLNISVSFLKEGVFDWFSSWLLSDSLPIIHSLFFLSPTLSNFLN